MRNIDRFFDKVINQIDLIVGEAISELQAVKQAKIADLRFNDLRHTAGNAHG